MKVESGIPPEQREAIASGLCRLLADTHLLMLKAQNYHWNVTGPLFRQLHKLFEEQYRELFAATDTIAERIRALGRWAPASYREYAQLATIHEENGTHDAMDMVRHLAEGHETIARGARALFRRADDADDQATCDLLDDRLRAHEKSAWMLRATLEK